MKVGAGTTGIHQACDRAQTFRITKKGPGSIEDMQNRNQIPTNDFLKGQVKGFSKFFSIVYSFTAITISANIIERYAEALIMISHVYQSKVNKEIIADGFICSGQHWSLFIKILLLINRITAPSTYNNQCNNVIITY